LNKKVKVPVLVRAEASKYIGDIEIESFEEYNEKAEQLLAKKNWTISTNCSNDFDVGDTEIMPFEEDDFEYYKKDV
jgi:hypothetical protein